ncbi:aminoglycoside phosphotransferase family protein [Roseibium sp.]|uniref:aminoglycoside phosphotransferase family protein n=1 Tax=Roseibium sp. TaxID=1936156 RepID=UPI003BB02810
MWLFEHAQQQNRAVSPSFHTLDWSVWQARTDHRRHSSLFRCPREFFQMNIDEHLVSALICRQFPQFADLPIEPVTKQGWDNLTYRLGEALSVRLPRDACYAAAVAKESDVLRQIGGHLSVEVPQVVATGKASEDYPLPWSIRRWIPGDTLENCTNLDEDRFAKSLGKCLVELRNIPATGGPYAGKHSFFRGCHPSIHGDEVQESLKRLDSTLDRERCLEIWHQGIGTAWPGAPVWLHGDVAPGNIIVASSEVKAFIDFGLCGLGDPACDFVMAWTYFSPESRQTFREACAIDEATWQRARAWALWKALVCLAGLSSPDTDGAQARALKEICADDFH